TGHSDGWPRSVERSPWWVPPRRIVKRREGFFHPYHPGRARKSSVVFFGPAVRRFSGGSSRPRGPTSSSPTLPFSLPILPTRESRRDVLRSLPRSWRGNLPFFHVCIP